MKNFTRRERLIISAAYRDASRICWEREWEARHGHGYKLYSPKQMAHYLAELVAIRRHQILKYDCDLPYRSKGYHV